MLPGYPGEHHESGTTRGITQWFTASSLCVSSKEPCPRPLRPGDGVSTYLALTFGTLLSSQGTDASFETIPMVSPGASLRCFQHYQAFPGSPTTHLRACRTG